VPPGRSGHPDRGDDGDLDGFVRAGKVRYLGCSNFTPASWSSAVGRQRAGGTPFVSLQPQYSLLSREIEARSAGLRAHGLGTLIWGPLASACSPAYQRA